ncbi:DUF4892 domain-containing protein [Pseudomonas sp. N3-W]|uniref:DUF4892 domain-containing protein n=1 Tax=Pseudomonas fungipugnans TaxID=3024217 RepID=A0ABT6QKX2_9PSED|nr:MULTISPECIES: DUF4892 domain-containing protein [unclassified Pseudomonas]MDI2591396.1 DUF4892 domain-containing protein [Pseudomonas sp. 681]UWF47808.1 DUF4892 domain-containing protein [Pseudomonas sp. N3-W]
MRSLSLLTLCCFSPLLFAADVPGSQDLPIVPRLADAQIVDYRPPVELERVYPLGSIRKISGQLRFDGQVSARGQTTSVTYELPPEHSATEAFTVAREALQKQGAELLFWCQARDCGESSLWANEVFGNSKLFGADEQQAYLLLRLAAPKDDTLVALYSITRGNRKAYLHVEQFEAATPLGELLPTSATLLRQLKDTGDLQLLRLKGAPDDNWLRLLSRGLNLDTTLRISISGPSAEAWRQALISQGVRAARMETGSLEGTGLHIELLR